MDHSPICPQNINTFGEYFNFLYQIEEAKEGNGHSHNNSIWKHRQVFRLEWKQLCQICRRIPPIDDSHRVLERLEARSQLLIDYASVCNYMNNSTGSLDQKLEEFAKKECEKFSLNILDYILRLPLDLDEKCLFDRKLLEVESLPTTLYEKIDRFRAILTEAYTPFLPPIQMNDYIVEDWVDAKK